MSDSRDTIAIPNACDSLRQDHGSLSAMLAGSVVFLDTNVLLLPYRSSPISTHSLFNVLQSLADKDRLFVAAHSLREFSLNRPRLISDMVKRILDLKSKEAATSLPDDPALVSTQAFAKCRKAADTARQSRRAYQDALQALAEEVEAWRWNDPVLRFYQSLWTPDRIAESPLSVDDLICDAKRRLSLRLPPGFQDAAKEVNSYGDLAIWHTMLAHAQGKPCHIVFVTLDLKNDWAVCSGDRFFSERPELANEFRQISGGHVFAVIRPSDLLEAFEGNSEATKDTRAFESRNRHVRALSSAFEEIKRQVLTNCGPFSMGVVGYERVAPFDAVIHETGPNNSNSCRTGVVILNGRNPSREVGELARIAVRSGRVDHAKILCISYLQTGDMTSFNYGTRQEWEFAPEVELVLIDSQPIAFALGDY